MPEPKRLDAAIEIIVVSGELASSQALKNQLHSSKVDALHIWSLHSILQFDLTRFDAIVLPYSEFKLVHQVVLGYLLTKAPQLFVFVTTRESQLEGLPIHPRVVYVNPTSFHAKDVETTILEDRKSRQTGDGDSAMDKFRRSAILDHEEEHAKVLASLICSNKQVQMRFLQAGKNVENLECQAFDSFRSFQGKAAKTNHLFVHCPLYVLKAVSDLDLLPNRYGVDRMTMLFEKSSDNESFLSKLPETPHVNFLSFDDMEGFLKGLHPRAG